MSSMRAAWWRALDRMSADVESTRALYYGVVSENDTLQDTNEMMRRMLARAAESCVTEAQLNAEALLLVCSAEYTALKAEMDALRAERTDHKEEECEPIGVWMEKQ